MKKIFLFIAGVFICMAADAQSLTFADLLYLKTQKTAKVFLKSKGYRLVNYSSGLEMYHKGTPAEENVEFHLYKNKGFVSYHTTDTAYVRSMERLISKRYKLILKDDNARSTFFRFGDSNISIMVNLINEPTVVGEISVGPVN
jgi:hypothetical protein